MKRSLIKWILFGLGVVITIIGFEVNFKGVDSSLIVTPGFVLIIVGFVLLRKEKDAKARAEGRLTAKERKQEKKMLKSEKSKVRAAKIGKLINEIDSATSSKNNDYVKL